MENHKQFGTGLRPTPKDKRDFRTNKLFGAFDVRQLPGNYQVGTPIKIKDQGDTDFCAAFAYCAVSEFQERLELNPLWQFAKIKQLEGDWQSWGADLRLVCKAAVKYGSLPETLSPYNLDKDRNFLANWENWEKNLDLSALYHSKKTFWRAEDTFDGFRTAMYLNKSAILTGVIWCREWTYAEDGIINEKGTPIEGHAVAAIGWKTINGTQYLVIQNSYGEEVGNGGIYYFKRDLVDKLFVYGGFLFVDLSPEEAKKIAWNAQTKIIEKIKSVLLSISDAFKELFKIKNL